MSGLPIVPHPSGRGWLVLASDGEVYEMRRSAPECAEYHRQLVMGVGTAPERTRRTTTGRVLALVGG